MNQVPRDNEVPPQDIPVPPVAPQAPGIRQEVLRNVEVPLAPAGIQINPPVILDFMGLTEHEKVICASFALKKDVRHWWMTVQMCRDVAAMSWYLLEYRAFTSHLKAILSYSNRGPNPT
ncbi:hypothetical protein TIFTF001_039835 [Ficus carica]|uniref:Uncharacterized protein n=1 Tax=Ficus carica TaxID=3494 RepID=A0AA87Z7N6_FICCA|nr:hypothetical protein TIFTF001_039821 [Ficus carica]GMN19521.1 hypothetical protein TIFTF001_039825 [Ficus carica]GMN19531.1 hypothetical protein TIFTF001_039831 [Ficus carica]GMN19553.1 hypothetical protein TIFTF001_039835 [Ficus carica]